MTLIEIAQQAESNRLFKHDADEIVTGELIKVLIPIFEKISNQKFEEVVEETESFLNKFNFRKGKLKND